MLNVKSEPNWVCDHCCSFPANGTKQKSSKKCNRFVIYGRYTEIISLWTTLKKKKLKKVGVITLCLLLFAFFLQQWAWTYTFLSKIRGRQVEINKIGFQQHEDESLSNTRQPWKRWAKRYSTNLCPSFPIVSGHFLWEH